MMKGGGDNEAALTNEADILGIWSRRKLEQRQELMRGYGRMRELKEWRHRARYPSHGNKYPTLPRKELAKGVMDRTGRQALN